MKKETKVVSTLINAQQDGSNTKVEGFCSGYTSTGTGGSTSCGTYSSGGATSTPEELDILV